MNRRRGPAMGEGTARVLLVEDDRVYQRLARELLQEVGVEVTVADDGRRAVEAMRNRSYDLILMDLEMPVMDGYLACEAIRRLPAGEGVPIIAMTAHILPSDRERCAATGMNDYVAKPIEPDLFYRTLAHWLSAAENATAPADQAAAPTLDLRLGAAPELASGPSGATVAESGIAPAAHGAGSAPSLLRRLERMLRDATPRARELLPPIESALGGRHRGTLETLHRRIGEFEFEQSLAIAGRLRETLEQEASNAAKRAGAEGAADTKNKRAR